jgi:uncharacterized protein (DUF2235 family)
MSHMADLSGNYTSDTLKELNQPYNKDYDSIQPYNAYDRTYAQFACDWETEFVQEEGQHYKRFMEKRAPSIDNDTTQETKEVTESSHTKMTWFKSIKSYIQLNYTRKTSRILLP